MAILIRSPICPLTPWGPGPDGRRQTVEAATGVPPKLPMAEPQMGSSPTHPPARSSHI